MPPDANQQPKKRPFSPFGGVEGEWALDAACLDADPEAFFPDRGGDVSPAKRLCRVCPVRAECLDYAVSTNQLYGVWGGMSERERTRQRRRQNRAR